MRWLVRSNDRGSVSPVVCVVLWCVLYCGVNHKVQLLHSSVIPCLLRGVGYQGAGLYSVCTAL